MNYQVDQEGYYGQFGGAYIPEMLHPNIEELRSKYLDIIYEPGFHAEFSDLLRNYVGRPTPLYLAQRLSEKYRATVYLKREDLCHTGAHKINNTIEKEEYNFDKLNIPDNHPARDVWDTFWISDDINKDKASGEKVLLRTHTSPVQIREMLK